MHVSIDRTQRADLKRIAKDYRCDVEALALVAIEELIAAHAEPPKAAAQRQRVTIAPPKVDNPKPAATSGRSYTAKRCECGASFVPTGARAKRCQACREGRPAAATDDDDGEFETVWNGAMGRNGVSISSH